VEFDFKRENRGKLWNIPTGEANWKLKDDESANWFDDEQNDSEDNTPSASNHIYQIDGPGYPLGTNIQDDRVFYSYIFRDWVMVKLYGTWYRCSPWLRWHQQLYVKPRTDDPTLLRRAGAGPDGPDEDWVFQQLDSGWIEIPDNPPAP